MSSFRQTEYVEDAAAAANPQGGALLLVREDARAGSLTTTDGDNVAARGTNAGELYVKHVDSIAITHAALTELASAIDTEVQVDIVSSALPSGAATSAKQDTIIGHLDGVETVLGTIDADTSNISTKIDTLAGAVAGTEVQVDVLTLPALPAGTNNIGDVDVLTLPALVASSAIIGNVRIDQTTPGTTNGVQVNAALPAGTNAIGKLAANSGVDIGDVDVTTCGTITPGTAATNLGKAVDSAAGATDTGVALLAVRDDTTATLTPVDGDYVPLRTNPRGALWVDLETRLASGQDSVSAVQSGTWTEANSAAMAASLSVMDDWDNTASDGASVSGDTAHDAADAGEPVKVGGKAYNMDGTAPGTAVAEGDRANFITDLEGRQCVTDFHPNHFALFEDHTSAQTNNQLKAAPGSGLSIYITDIVISNGATAGSLKLVEDEGGTPAQICQTYYFAINGGAVINWKTPKKLTANKSLGFTSVSCTTHSIEIHGFIGP